MKIVLELDGNSYVSRDFDESIVNDIDTFADFIYNGVSDGDPLQLTLQDGSVLILGRQRVQQSVILITP